MFLFAGFTAPAILYSSKRTSRTGRRICGPSGQEKSIEASQQSLSSLLSSDFSERFGQQSAVLQNLSNMLTPISEAGPDQAGFGPQELAALGTQVGEGVGANYAKASQALNNTLAARGGGNEFLPTGASAALKGTLASSAANQLSAEQLAITRANYGQGRQNWQQATAGLSALANQFDPTAYSSGAQKGFDAAFGMSNAINQQQNQETADIIGGVTALAGAATGGLGNLDTQGTSSPMEQVGNFLTGMKG